MNKPGWLFFVLLSLLLLALFACDVSDAGDDDDDENGGGDDDENDDVYDDDVYDDDVVNDDDDDDVVDDDDSPSPNSWGDPESQTQYIAIGAAGIKQAVLPLLEYHGNGGMFVTFDSTQDIDATYEGHDLAARIRNFLIERLDSEKLQYVLLIGTHHTLPARLVSPDPNYPSEYSTLTDVYYGDLSGDFDVDGDGLYGEYFDDDIDWTEEMFVGRLPFDDPELVAGAVERILLFTEQNPAHKNDALLVAAQIAVPGDAAILMQSVANQIITPLGMSTYRMYENDVFDRDDSITREKLLYRLNNHTPGFVLMTVHGNEECAYAGDPILCNTDAQYFSGDKPLVMMSSGCSNASLGTEWNLGAAMLGSIGAAFIASSTYTNPGLLGEGSLLFLVMVEKTLADNLPLGPAMSLTRAQYMDTFFNDSGYYDIGVYWMNFYGFNLFGDPAMPYWAAEK